MAHPAPSLSNTTIALLLLAVALFSCNNNAPIVKINIANAGFKQRQGTLYHNHTPFTGIAYELFDNGDTAKVIPYRNGKEQDITKWWYPNKQLAQQRFFNKGRKEGIHTGWWDSGKLKFEYHFANDEYEGEVKEWFSDGKVCRVFHYVKGHEEGNQKMWWEDGKIRANYSIVNGEKFGLFGQKLCVNVLKK